MERVSLPELPPDPFSDALGERRLIPDSSQGRTVELLCLRPELAAVPSFEFSLRERVSRLASFNNACYARMRGVDRLKDRESTLVVASDHTSGTRLSTLLTDAEGRRLPIDIDMALCLIRQLVPAAAMLHEKAHDVAHGALGPERLIVTPQARLVVAEYVLGGALEQLRFSHERYWKELRIPLPRTAGLPHFDQRVDVLQIGIVALSLILGRLLRHDEYPARVGELIASTWAISPRGGYEPLPPGLRNWLARAVQLEPRHSFSSAIDARTEFDRLLGDTDLVASPSSLEAFLARYLGETTPVTPVLPFRPLDREVERPSAPSSAVTSPRPPPAPTPDGGSPAAPAREERASATLSDPPGDDDSTTHPRAKRWKPILAALAALLVVVVAGGFFAARKFFPPPPPSAKTGTLVITTNPGGVQAVVDGQLRGVTPLTMTLAPGQHVLELRGVGEPRTLPVTIAAGTQVAQYVELQKPAAATGQLQVRTTPPGAEVTVDGVSRGASPTTVADLEPGLHNVVLTGELGSIRQPVTIESGVTASLVVPLSAPEGAPVSGWVAVTTPVPVQIFERDQLLGTSATDRIMVAVGRHELDLRNTELGYRVTRSVLVSAGKTIPIRAELPKGTLSLNAQPWAEAWIDGERVGETPIGNLSLDIGAHDVVLRHPDLGEQHRTIVVTLKEPARLSVDLRKK